MDAVTKTIARSEYERIVKINMDHSYLVGNEKFLRFAIRHSVSFAVTCYDQAKKDYREYRLEKINSYLEQRKIRKEKAVYALSSEHISSRRMLGCFVSPFGEDAGRKVTGQMSFLQSMVLEVISLDVRHGRHGTTDTYTHEYGPYTVYVCKVKSHPAKSFGGNHYRKNELAGMIYTFDHVAA